MPSIFNNPLELMIVASAFGVVLSLWLIGMIFHQRSRSAQRQHMEHRLGLLEEDGSQTRTLRLWRNGQEATALVPDDPGFKAWVSKIRHLPRQAGIQMPIQSLILAVVGIALLAFVATQILTGNLLAAAAAPIVWLAAVWLYIGHRINQQTSRFERQLVDALHLIARSLRAGHPLPGAFHLVAEELESPIDVIFADICHQQSLGVSLEEALRKAAADITSDDFKFFATSVAIQIRAGGNLADMMDRLALVIRDRIRLAQRVKVLTAQTQFSKRILLVLPVFVFVLLNVLNATYMRPLYQTRTGLLLMGAAVISMVIGTLVMNQMAKLRY